MRKTPTGSRGPPKNDNTLTKPKPKGSSQLAGSSSSSNTLSPKKPSRTSRSPSPSSTTPRSATSSVRDVIAQARLKKANNKAVQQEEQNDGGSRSLNVIVKQAKSSGMLNIFFFNVLIKVSIF